eukprot:532391_1
MSQSPYHKHSSNQIDDRIQALEMQETVTKQNNDNETVIVYDETKEKQTTDADDNHIKKPTNTSPINNINHQLQDLEQMSYLKLLKNCRQLFPRLAIIFISMFLLLLSVAYATGQISELQVTDYFCDRPTPEQIADHSRKIHDNEGDYWNPCWSHKRIRVDPKLLWSQSSYSSESRYDTVSIFKFIGFIISSLILLSL